jgi:hypothetical protein
VPFDVFNFPHAQFLDHMCKDISHMGDSDNAGCRPIPLDLSSREDL